MNNFDYPKHLEAMWQKALEPRAANAPTVISTFAGGGGSSTGYHMAGFKELLAIEWDDNSVQTLRLNYPDLDIYHGDIAKISVEEVLRRTGLKPGELDIFDGSPPCQGFSTAGKREMNDDRNQLFREYVRLLRGLKPKVFVMENVSGMVKGKMKIIFVEILKELKASGYKVSARLLNAKYFHVPQSRQRMIFIGVREDLGIDPSHPKAESGEISVNSALVRVLAGDFAEENARVKCLSRYIKPGSDVRSVPVDVLREVYPSMIDRIKKKSFMIRLRRLSANDMHPTIAKRFIQCNAEHCLHPNEDRYFCTNELKRFGSFPDGYAIPGDYNQAVERIGNSVPPLFMEAIARHIRTEILDKIEQPNPTNPTL
jgi:DNA (cytosine-5)-methyltransferase 1